MITAFLVIGIILVTTGVIITLYSIYKAFIENNPMWLLGFLVGTLLFIIIGSFFITDTPTKQDVLDHKAHYVKEINTYDNDTVVTYRIVFNKKQSSCQ